MLVAVVAVLSGCNGTGMKGPDVDFTKLLGETEEEVTASLDALKQVDASLETKGETLEGTVTAESGVTYDVVFTFDDEWPEEVLYSAPGKVGSNEKALLRERLKEKPRKERLNELEETREALVTDELMDTLTLDTPRLVKADIRVEGIDDLEWFKQLRIGYGNVTKLEEEGDETAYWLTPKHVIQSEPLQATMFATVDQLKEHVAQDDGRAAIDTWYEEEKETAADKQ